MRGTDGMMVARNRVLAELERTTEVSAATCELARWVICGDEELDVGALFPPEAAERLRAACTLTCPSANER